MDKDIGDLVPSIGLIQAWVKLCVVGIMPSFVFRSELSDAWMQRNDFLGTEFLEDFELRSSNLCLEVQLEFVLWKRLNQRLLLIHRILKLLFAELFGGFGDVGLITHQIGIIHHGNYISGTLSFLDGLRQDIVNDLGRFIFNWDVPLAKEF